MNEEIKGCPCNDERTTVNSKLDEMEILLNKIRFLLFNTDITKNAREDREDNGKIQIIMNRIGSFNETLLEIEHELVNIS